jgi:hypothetical protein
MKAIGNKAQLAFNDVSPDERPDLMTEPEYQAAFAKLENDWFKGRSECPPRNAFYVTGLPGAGKSTLVKDIIRSHIEKGEEAPLVIDFDELRPYHPRYREYVAQDSINAAARVNKSVEKMIDWVFAESAKRGIDVIVDGSAMGREITRGIFAPYLQQGYTVETIILATPSTIAQQSVRLRYEETFDAARRGHQVLPRWVESRQQSKAAENLIETIRTLVEDGICKKFSVTTRDKETLFAAEHIEGKESELLALVRHETAQRSLSKPEQESFKKNEHRIAELTSARERYLKIKKRPLKTQGQKIKAAVTV